MKFPAARRIVNMLVLIGSCFNMADCNQPSQGPSAILDGITNVATSATNFRKSNKFHSAKIIL